LRRLALVGLLALIGCSGSADLTAGQLDWCRANSSGLVFDTAVQLGYTAEEMTLLLDDVTVTGWSGPEQDARYLRACRVALGVS
jgi:hypothetical protein